MSAVQDVLEDRAERGARRGPGEVLRRARSEPGPRFEPAPPSSRARATLSAVAVAAAVALVAVWVHEPAGRTSLATDGGTGRPDSSVIPYPEPPETLVAGSLDGFVEVDSTTGAVLGNFGEVGDGVTMPTPLADGSVIVHRASHGCDDPNDVIVRYRRVGGAPEEIVRGRLPAVTNDGDLLAYADGGSCVAGGDAGALVVRQLDTGREQRWTLLPDIAVSTLSWSHDGDRIALGLVWPDGRPEVRVLDLREHDSVGEAPVLSPATPATTWRLPAFRGAYGTLAVVESPTDTATPWAPQPSRIISIDPGTGEVLASLVRRERSIATLDVDGSGRHLLWVEIEPKVDGVRGQQDFLYRWEGEDPVAIGDEGFGSAAW